MIHYRNWLLLSLAALLLVFARPASAHGYIVRAIPDDLAVLQRAPVRVSYWFSEDLEAEYSSLTITDSQGSEIATGGVDPEDDSLMSARLPASLPDGAYIVTLRVAFASDGHISYERRAFFVGERSDIGVNRTTAGALPLEVVWRMMVLSAFTVLFGALTLYNGVLVPAWGNPQYPAGLLPPRVMRRLNIIVVGALAVAFIGTILSLVQQSMAFSNADLARVISDRLWSIVRGGTRFGEVWNTRMTLLEIMALLFGASHYLSERQPETVRAFWAANAWLGALLLGTLSVASHAAGSPLLGWPAIVSDWAHTLAVGFWIGGLAALVLVLPAALAPYDVENRRRALLAALNRFSPLATGALIVVIATGIFSALLWIRTPGQLTSAYAVTLAAKIVLVLLLMAVGGVHFAALHPARFARLSGMVERVREFLPTLRLEVGLAALVITAAALLSATPVPKPDFADQNAPPPTLSQTVGDLTVTASLLPGSPGVNSYELLVTRDGQAADALDVRTQLADPSLDWRGEWHTADAAGDGLYVATGDDIRRDGGWWMLVDVGGDTRFAFRWDIVQDAAALATVTPNALNVVALLGVIAALGYAAYPRVKRFYRRLDLRPVMVVIALGALLAIAGILALGNWGIQSSQAVYEASANPTPQVVNPVLPDRDSLARGSALFAAHCVWPEGAQNRLVRDLPRLRDETLYAIVLSGGRELPACDASLTDAERWDIVNYVRTLK